MFKPETSPDSVSLICTQNLLARIVTTSTGDNVSLSITDYEDDATFWLKVHPPSVGRHYSLRDFAPFGALRDALVG